jgi:hypothetical protein
LRLNSFSLTSLAQMTISRCPSCCGYGANRLVPAAQHMLTLFCSRISRFRVAATASLGTCNVDTGSRKGCCRGEYQAASNKFDQCPTSDQGNVIIRKKLQVLIYKATAVAVTRPSQAGLPSGTRRAPSK